MTLPDVLSRLRNGDRLLLDGATGTEIRRRSDDATRQSAAVDDPDLIREIHDDYLRAGADIITTNTFSSSRVSIELGGSPDASMEYYNKMAAEIAREEVEKLNPDGFVAGGIAIPRAKQRHGTPGSPETLRDYTDQSKVLADAGVDMLIYEFIGYIPDCVAAARAGAETGLPVFIGLRWVTIEAKMESGETLEELLEALDGLRVDGILPMCCNPTSASATLPKLRSIFDGVIGAYPRIGEATGDYTPDEFAQYGQEWVDAGGQIIGGCCNTTPAHIAALEPVVHAA